MRTNGKCLLFPIVLPCRVRFAQESCSCTQRLRCCRTVHVGTLLIPVSPPLLQAQPAELTILTAGAHHPHPLLVAHNEPLTLRIGTDLESQRIFIQPKLPIFPFLVRQSAQPHCEGGRHRNLHVILLRSGKRRHIETCIIIYFRLVRT